MAADKPHTDPILAAIEAKIAAWTAVRESYMVAVSLDGPLGESVSVSDSVSARLNPSRGPSGELPVGVFRDKTLKDAIPIYLGAMRRKQTNKEIAAGLQAGLAHG